MKANYKRYRSVSTKHLDDYQILAIFEHMHKETSAVEKANIHFEILKEVKLNLWIFVFLTKRPKRHKQSLNLYSEAFVWFYFHFSSLVIFSIAKNSLFNSFNNVKVTLLASFG